MPGEAGRWVERVVEHLRDGWDREEKPSNSTHTTATAPSGIRVVRSVGGLEARQAKGLAIWPITTCQRGENGPPIPFRSPGAGADALWPYREPTRRGIVDGG